MAFLLYLKYSVKMKKQNFKKGGKMKIVLIEPRSPGLNIFSHAKLPRLGLLIIGAIAKEKGHSVRVVCEELGAIDWEKIKEADFVGVSSLTSTAPRALEIIKKTKNLRPNIPVVAGGPHFSFLPEEALAGGADIVIRYEGEETFDELLTWLSNGGNHVDLADIQGLSYSLAGKYFHNSDREPIKNLDDLPFPDFSILENSEKMSNLIFQLGRGCQFNCSFCTVTQMFGRKKRIRRDIDSILNEIEYILNTQRKKIVSIIPRQQNIFFYDDNFFMDSKFTKEFLREIISRRLKFKFSAQIRIDAAKDQKFLSLARQAGMDYCYIGYESANEETLKSYNKKLKVEDMARWTKVIRSHGIRIHGMFVLGGEHDTRQDIINTVRFAIKNHIDTVQFLILTPIPGTPLFQKLEAEGRIINRDWSKYDGHSVNYQPKMIGPRELRYSVLLDAMPNFYSLGRSIPKFFSVVFHFPFFSRFSWREKVESLAFHLYGHHVLEKFKRMKLTGK